MDDVDVLPSRQTAALKLMPEVQQGGYDLVTIAELKKWIDSGKMMFIVDTMPDDAGYGNIYRHPGSIFAW